MSWPKCPHCLTGALFLDPYPEGFAGIACYQCGFIAGYRHKDGSIAPAPITAPARIRSERQFWARLAHEQRRAA